MMPNRRKKRYGYKCDDGHEFEAEQWVTDQPIKRCRVSCCNAPNMICGFRARTCGAPCHRAKVTTREEKREEDRRQHAKASPRRRRYDICTALNMTKLSVELSRLERLGVDSRITGEWKRQGQQLLNEILKVSDSLKTENSNDGVTE